MKVKVVNAHGCGTHGKSFFFFSFLSVNRDCALFVCKRREYSESDLQSECWCVNRYDYRFFKRCLYGSLEIERMGQDEW